MTQIFDVMQEQKIVAVLRRLPVSSGTAVVEALAAGGVRLVEVTMDNPDALRLIDAFRGLSGTDVWVGAGTVVTQEQLRDAAAAGAVFAVSPHWDPDLWAESVRLNIPYVPGAMTPSEIVSAYRAGAVMVKVFPAGPLGSGYIRELRGPLKDPRFMVTGGIHAGNIRDYLQAGADVAGVGGALLPVEAIQTGQFSEITAKARELVALVAHSRRRKDGPGVGAEPSG